MSDVVKSTSYDQTEILRGIARLHCPEGFECDITYGNGQFYKDLPQPAYRFDIDPQVEGVVAASSHALPLPSSKLANVVFDPPFLTYVRAGREGNGRMIMSKRFSGYWTYDELSDHYRTTIHEAHRILKRGGIFVFKCQDIVHNHRLHCTHANVIMWAQDAGFRLRDLFILNAQRRMPSPNRTGKQRHARIHHSYFLVLEKK